MSDPRRILGVFALAMINVAAIVSLRNLSIMVEYGFGCVFYYLLAAFVFFIPSAFVCAELATGWPQAGGVYRWVSTAFGPTVGFIAIWFAWMLSVSWFPTVLTFTGSAIAFIINPELIHQPVFMIASMLSIFWGATFINFLGMRTSSWVSTAGVLLGTLLPGVLIIGLGVTWWLTGRDLKITMDLQHFIPDFKLTNMVFFAGVILSLAGMEMSAFHAREAKNPRKNYPISILLSAVVILAVYIFGSLSIAFVVSPRDVNLFAGLMQAFTEFFKAFDMLWVIPWLALLAAIGSLAGVNTWILGPAKGILVCAQDGFLPPWMQTVNKKGIPIGTLLVQAVIGSLLALVFFVMPNVNSAFWIITALTVQFAMAMYLLIFLAAIKLRYSHPDVLRSYVVPGGKLGMWGVAGIGSLASIFAFVICFVPPGSLDVGNLFVYQSFLIGGFVLLMLPPIGFILFKKHHWRRESVDFDEELA